MATNKSISKKMRAIELTGHVTSQGGSIGSALFHVPVLGAQGVASTRSQVVLPSSSKRQKLGEVPSQSKKMRISRPAKGSTAFAITEIPLELEPGGTRMTTRQDYVSFGQNTETALSSK